MNLLDGKVSFVTGGGMGIGRAICLAFAREGSAVVVADLNEESGTETVQLIRDSGAEARFLRADVSDEEQVRQALEFTVETFGRLDIACNSAAVSRGSGPIHEYSREVFDSTLDLCLTNTWLCMKYEIPLMLENGGGAIVNISSNASLRGQRYNTAYAAAKAGVNLLTKSSAGEYAAKGVRINAVSPGIIRTPGIDRYFEEEPKKAEGLKRAAPMKRLGEPEEVAEAVVFLCSDRASFITGQLLSVDGGQAIA